MRRLLVLLPLWITLSAHADPRVNYLLHCGGCHLPDGSSAPPEVPTLRDELGPIVASAAGRDYIARVPGAAQAPMSDAQLAEVLNWVLAEFNAKSLPDGFTPLSTDEVTKSRRNILADPLAHRARLWPALSVEGTYAR